MGHPYSTKANWSPVVSRPMQQANEEALGITGHPQAVVDKINRSLLDRGIMPIPSGGTAPFPRTPRQRAEALLRRKGLLPGQRGTT